MSRWRIFVSTLIVVGVLLAVYFLALVQEVLLLLLFAILIGSALRAPVTWLQARGLPRILAAGLVYLALIVGFGALLFFVAFPLVQESVTFAQNLPDKATSLQQQVLALARGLGLQPENFDIAGTLRGSLNQAPSLAGGLLRGTLSAFGVVANTLFVLVLSFFWVLERDNVLGTWLPLLGGERTRRASVLANEIEQKLGAYVRGQVLLGLIVGVLSYIGLRVIGVPYTLLLATIAGITELIPNIGPILGGAVAVLVALTVSPQAALLTLLLYFLIQQAENYLLVPVVQKTAVGISPFTILVAILIGGTLYGLAGAILAVPVAGAISVVVQRLVIEPRRAQLAANQPAVEEGQEEGAERAAADSAGPGRR